MFKTTSLIAEYLIIGFFSSLILMLIILITFNIHDLEFLYIIKEFTSLILILLTIFSYTLGLILQKVISLFPSGWINLLINEKFRIRFVLKHKRKTLNGIDWYWTCISHVSKTQTIGYIDLLQLGSNNLLEKLNFYESIVRILKSIQYLIPILGVLLISWIHKVIDFDIIRGYVILMIVTVFAIIAFTIQLRNYKIFIKMCIDSMENKTNE